GAAVVVISIELEEIGDVAELGEVLAGAGEGAEAEVLGEFPADLDFRADRADRAEDVAVELVLAVGPERLPLDDLRIGQDQPPEGGEGAVRRALAFGDGGVPEDQLAMALLRPAPVDTPLGRPGAAMRAVTDDEPEALPRRFLQQPVERAGTGGGEGEAVERVALDIILDDGEDPVAVVRIVEAGAARRLVPDIHLEHLLEAGVAAQRPRVAALVEIGEALEAALFGLGNDSGQHVPVRVFRRAADRAEARGAVIFAVDGGVIAALPVGLVFLPAMIGKGPARLGAAAARPVPGRRCQPERVDRGALDDGIENLADALVHEGYRADLDGDRPFGHFCCSSALEAGRC